MTGAAAASAPGDVYAAVNGWLHAPRAIDASYLPAVFCPQVHAAAAYHGLPGLPASAFRAEYQETARDFYLNKITWEEAYSKLPSKSRDLFQEAFLNIHAPGSVRYWEILADSQSYRWRSVTPLRVYYGEQDEVISEFIGSLPHGFQKAVGGAETAAVNAGATANHRGTFLFAIADQQKWFSELRETAGSSPRQPTATPTTATPAPSPASTPSSPAGKVPSAP